MKKTLNIIISSLILFLLLSSCSSPIKVNEKLTGEGEFWSVAYNISGHADTKRNDNDVYEYTSYGSYDLLIKYKGDTADLQGIRSFTVECPGFNGLTKESDDASFLQSMIHRQGSPTAQTLVYFNYNDESSITIEWDGEISGEETIKLN